MRAFYEPSADEIAKNTLHLEFKVKIDVWRRTFFATMANFQKLRAAKLTSDVANQNDDVPFVFEPLRGDVLFVINQSDHRDRRRRVDNSSRALIIQRDVSTCDGRSKRAACFCHAFNSFTQLPEVFGLVGIAEVEAIRNGERPCA